MKLKPFFFFTIALFLVVSAYAQDVASAADTSEGIKHFRRSADTLNLTLAKSYVLLIDVNEDSQNVQIVGDDQEKNELLRNFDNMAFEIIKINNYTYISLENGQFIDVSEEGASYQATVYWSGKEDDKLVLQEGKQRATEFVAKQLGLSKESSYLTNSKKYKQEVTDLIKKDHFTERSREVMNAFLQRYAVPKLCFIQDYLVFNKKQQHVKSVVSFFLNEKGRKQKWQEIELNNEGQPLKVENYNFDGDLSWTSVFEYEKGRLNAIKGEGNVQKINYNDDALILSHDMGGAIETKKLWLENSVLMQKTYLIMKDDGNEMQNYLTEQIKEGNCIQYYVNNELSSADCFSQTNQFPYEHVYTSYQEGKVLQEIKYYVEKKSDVEFQLIQENSNSDNEKTTGIFTLNDHGLLDNYSRKEGKEENNVQLQYMYY